MGSFERRNDFEMEVEGEDNEKGIQMLQDFMMVSEYQENRKSLRYLGILLFFFFKIMAFL